MRLLGTGRGPRGFVVVWLLVSPASPYPTVPWVVSRGQTDPPLHFYIMTSSVGEERSGDLPIRKLCSVQAFLDSCGMLI